VVSYNILADAYASTKFAREQLYAYCRAEALSVDYRKQLAAWELGQYHADVLCLQEVSRHVFLRPTWSPPYIYIYIYIYTHTHTHIYIYIIGVPACL
jgi:mRNA deadenylase 3'-5' endonuclease subunit Ccr4